jgi:hypothetical protein
MENKKRKRERGIKGDRENVIGVLKSRNERSCQRFERSENMTGACTQICENKI